MIEPNFLEFFLFIFNLSKFWLISIYNFVAQYFIPSYKNIKNKNVIITGAANGLGRELSLLLTLEGCNVIGVDIDAVGLIKTRKYIFDKSGELIKIYQCDLRNFNNIDVMYDLIKQKFDFIDMVVCNAAVCHSKSIIEMSLDEYTETYDVNLHSCFYITKKFLPDMLLRNDGHFIYVSSIAGSATAAKMSTYCSTKAALSSFGESLYLELQHIYKRSNVNITIATPFIIATGLFQNCKSRLPLLFPTLKSDYVAHVIVNAIKKNQYHVAIGKLMYFISFIKTILPIKCLLQLYKLSGGISIMDDYLDIRTDHREDCYSTFKTVHEIE